MDECASGVWLDHIMIEEAVSLPTYTEYTDPGRVWARSVLSSGEVLQNE